MKNKKGFTLVEILVVIAILSILVIIAVPNVLKIVKKNKENIFLTQAKNIYKEAVQEYVLSSEEYNEKNRFYYAGDVEENRLELSGSKKVYYDIEIYSDKVTKFIVSDENYSISINDVSIALKDIAANILKAKEEIGYVSLTKPIIYGVSWNGSGSTLTRTDDSASFSYTNNPDGTITSDFDNAAIYRDMVDVTDEFGNVFVKIPKFYIKKTVNGDAWTWQISTRKIDSNYYLPACFYDEQSSQELSYILVGKYNASTDGTYWESKSGRAPVLGDYLDKYTKAAYDLTLRSKYQFFDIHMIDALQTLFYVEYATLDSQSIMTGFTAGGYIEDTMTQISSISGNNVTVGNTSEYMVGNYVYVSDLDQGNWFSEQGRTDYAEFYKVIAINGNVLTLESIPNISWGALTVGAYVYAVSQVTGLTDGVTTKSGSPNSNPNYMNPMKYRGIENLYGNCYQYVAGIYTVNGIPYVAKDATLYPNNYDQSGYSALNYTVPSSTGEIIKMGFDPSFPFAQLPIQVGSYINYKDIFKRYPNASAMVLYGGDWMDGASAGISAWTTNTNYDNFEEIYRCRRLAKTP